MTEIYFQWAMEEPLKLSKKFHHMFEICRVVFTSSSSIMVFIWWLYNYGWDEMGLEWGHLSSNKHAKRILTHSMAIWGLNNAWCESEENQKKILRACKETKVVVEIMELPLVA